MTKIIIDVLDFIDNNILYDKIMFEVCSQKIIIQQKVNEIIINDLFTNSILDFSYIEEIYFINEHHQSKHFYVPIYINEINKITCYCNKTGDYYFEIYYLRKNEMLIYY